MEMETQAFGSVGLLVMVLVFLFGLLYVIPIPLWIAAWAANAYVGLFTLIGMRLRRVPPGTIINARISAINPITRIEINRAEMPELRRCLARRSAASGEDSACRLMSLNRIQR